MPSLQDALRADLSRYSPVATPPAIPILLPHSSANPLLRFILPPFHGDPDSLRQFDTSSATPKIRVIPIPPSTGNSKTTTQAVASISARAGSGGGGRSSSGGMTFPLTAKTVTFTTTLLPASAVYKTSVIAAKSFQLIGLGVSGPCEVRLYGTALAQATDAYRATGAPIPAEVTSNIISCVTFDTVPYIWNWQNRCGANQDVPQTTNIYCTVLNTNPISNNPVTCVIGYVPLET